MEGGLVIMEQNNA